MAYNPALDQLPASRSATGLSIEIHHQLASVASEWKAFQQRAAGGPHQSYEWIKVWLASHPMANLIEPAIAFCRDAQGNCVAILPFGIRRPFGCTTLEWLGADQGNYSSGLFDPAYWRRPEAPSAQALLDELLEAIPGIDAVHLADHPATLADMPNPLSALPGVAAPSDGFAFDIGPDWRAEYEARFSARYRRNLKRHERKLETHGAVGLYRLDGTAERLRALDTLFSQKSEWFVQRGIPDIFASEDMRRFYRTLVTAPLDDSDLSVRVYELRVGDKTIAACIDILHNNCYYGLLASTSSCELARHGPGNLLFHRLVDQLAEEGVARFDCGAGENEQKLRWSTERRERHHVLVPVTEVGRLYAAAMTAGLIAKAQVKQSVWLWRMANLVRRYKPRLLASLPFLAVGGATLILLEA